MVLKSIDDKYETLKQLEDLLKKSQSEAQQKLIKSEINKIKAGHQAEKDNAFYLEDRLKDSKNIILLSDIRLIFNNSVIQMDHVLITRFGIEILESKSSTGIMTINNDGSIKIRHFKKVNTYPNPLEQVNRHARILKEFLMKYDIFPTRIQLLGLNIETSVIINPKTNLTNKKLPEHFHRADSFISMRQKKIDNISPIEALKSAITMYNKETMEKIAQILIDNHKPMKYDYSKKFKVPKSISSDNISKKFNSKKDESKICPRCKKGKLVRKEVKNKAAKEKYGNDFFFGCDRYPKCRYTEQPA